MIKPTTISTKMKLAGGLLSFVIIFYHFTHRYDESDE